MSQWKFVSSKDIPAEMAEAVAHWGHKRGCGVFNGRGTSSEPFKGAHRDSDMVWASIHVADVCNALHITVGRLLEDQGENS